MLKSLERTKVVDSPSIAEELISQIEDMLREVSGHTVVSADAMQNGLLDLMITARLLLVSAEDSL